MMFFFYCPLAVLAAIMASHPSLTHHQHQEETLPTVFEYFASSGPQNLTGLVAENKEFRLNGKPIRIISGALHYFRIHPSLWRDRLRKLRASGANTVETYVPWNLHEPRRGEFDFGDGNNDFSLFLDVRRYIQMAQEEDLLVLFRPGPYICSEWDFGGFPSWLLRDPDMRVRENYPPFLQRVKGYLDALLPQVVDLQFTRGGSIIGAQIENEYSSFSHRDPEYLEFIRQTFLQNGLDCLHFTSDNDNGFDGTGEGGQLPDVLKTANFQSNLDTIFERVSQVQPDKPLMGMEFWAGWFNHWSDPSKAGLDSDHFKYLLDRMFSHWNASVNFYMFHGGTNFGFMAGANSMEKSPFYLSDTTSYDYDALLTEAGDYTAKYNFASEVIEKYQVPKLRKPSRPKESRKVAYPSIKLTKYLSYNDIIDRVPASHRVKVEKPMSMEALPINNGNGQSYGLIVYRTLMRDLKAGDVFKGSWAKDFASLLVDGDLVDMGSEYWINSVKEVPLRFVGNHTLDLVIENLGRVNYGGRKDLVQTKGLVSSMELNGEELRDLEIIPLEFKNAWVKSLEGWKDVEDIPKAPCLLQSTFTIEEEQEEGVLGDTWLNMTAWHKGFVFVNGFNIGRYWKVGPQQHLYLPGPFLRSGENTITIFEQLQPASNMEILFSDKPHLGQRETLIKTGPIM